METTKLSLQHFREKKPFNTNKGLSVFNITDILGDNPYEIDFDVYLPTKGCNLQREFCWTLLQKQEFILSLLKDITIPPFAFICYERKVFRVIDGKQRLGAWIDFCKGIFPIEVDGSTYYFSDLDNRCQGELMFSRFVQGDVAYEYEGQLISDNDKIEWFDRINFKGTTMDIEHMKKLKEL
jgi:hypothetical protein